MVPRPSPLTDLLARKPVLLDGALGTALFARGVERPEPPDRWNLEKPEEVARVHDSHREAGSQVLQTNTFRSNALALTGYGCGSKVMDFNQRGAEIALECAARAPRDTRPLVAGNIGPSGRAIPEGTGSDTQEWTDAFAQQAEALALAGVDYLGLETFVDAGEALIALDAVRSATDLEISVSLVPIRRDAGFGMTGGGSVTDALKTLTESGATALGINCVTSEDSLAALPVLLEGTTRPLIIRPNAGLPREDHGHLVFPQDPEEFASHMVQAVRLGAAAVGGCCGTHAGFTAALRTALG